MFFNRKQTHPARGGVLIGDSSPISGVSVTSWSTFHWFLKSKTGRPHCDCYRKSG